jgi:hypothetical protein
MTLTKEDIARIKDFLPTIKHVAHGGNTSNGDIWPTLNQIKYEKTGAYSRSDCSSCKVELFQEFQNAIETFQTTIFNLTNNN